MNKDILKYLGTFVLGFGCGIGAFYLYNKKKEELDEVMRIAEDDETESEFLDGVEENWDEMNEVIEAMHYRPVYEDRPSFAPTKEEKMKEIPYVIKPEDFGMFGYEDICLTYYSDGVLADDHDDLVEYPEQVVGTEWRREFEQGETVVYVRNDARKCDYEIALDFRTYTDIVDEHPYLLHNILDSATAQMIEDEDE